MTPVHSRAIPPVYLLMALISAVLMGTIGVISKMTGLNAETVTFFRLGFGALLMSAYLFARGQLHLVQRWPSWQVLLNGVLLASFILFYVQAMNYTSMANAIMIVYLAPVAASIAAHCFLSERLTSSSALLIACALFGFAMMMEFKLDLAGNSNDRIGMGLALVSMCAYAGFILVNRKVPATVHVYTRTWYQLAIGALCILPFMLLSPTAVMPNPTQWSWLLAGGLLPGFLGILCAVLALQHLPTTVFGTLAYAEAIAVVVFGWVIFGESLNALQLGGCGIILASGVLQAALSSRKTASQPDNTVQTASL